MTSANGGAEQQRRQLTPLQDVMAAAALGCFVGSIFAGLGLSICTLLCLVLWPSSVWSWTLAAFVATISLIPLWERNGPFAERFMDYCCGVAQHYFPVDVVAEAEFSKEKPYIIGLEPHSALPTAMPAAFGLQSPLLPEGIRGRTYGMASSICFQIPFVRHMYWWVGVRPIERHVMKHLLQSGQSLVLVPGGVQECLYMRKGAELAFVKKRKGFIRMAMQNGAAVVPCFVFGQSGTYNWHRLGPPVVSDAWVQALSRRVGMVPMALVGRWGTHAPIRSRMTVVFGKPIEVPRLDSPSDELLQEYLDKYIAGLQEIFDKHKAAAGYESYPLVIM